MTNHYLPAYALRPYALLRHAYDALDADERRDGFRLAAGLYLETDRMQPLNGSEALPDNFYRNMAVAFSQLSRYAAWGRIAGLVGARDVWAPKRPLVRDCGSAGAGWIGARVGGNRSK